ncbi:MAG: heme NO-binding domain-containing protein, partial [Candidatus Acidiferrales bacterium]
MKGIIFNLLEEVVTREHGADAWDALLESAGVDGAYTCLGSYSDDEMRKLVDAASEMLKIPPTEVMCWFGRQSMCLLSQQYPKFFCPRRLCPAGPLHPLLGGTIADLTVVSKLFWRQCL